MEVVPKADGIVVISRQQSWRVLVPTRKARMRLCSATSGSSHIVIRSLQAPNPVASLSLVIFHKVH